MKTYNNKIALVTGAASGIGRELARLLAHYGATVVATDINKVGVDAAAEEIQQQGGTCVSKQLDVSDEVAVNAVYHQVASEFNGLDYAFNNAGICLFGEVKDMTSRHWKQLIDININGAIYGTTTAYEIMCKQGRGHIVNTASASGLMPWPTLSAYAMTKHAVVGLSTSLREEARLYGVNVSVVCPGPVATNLFNVSESLQGDFNEFNERASISRYGAAESAADILKGVSKNKDKIVFPGSARNFYRFARNAPDILRRKVYERFLLTRFRES